MLNITIISVGGLKERYWREAANEYIKRLHTHAKVDIVEVPEERVTSTNDRKRILSLEADKIIKAIPKISTVITLDRTGVQYPSAEWADKLEEWSKFGNKITFIIGGPLGLSAEVLNKSAAILSFSKMTFTHQMSRVILLEQIYRGSMIIKGGTYHY